MNKNQSKTLSRAKKLRLGRPLGVFWTALLLVGYGCGEPNSAHKFSSDVHSNKFDEDMKEGLQKGDRGTESLNTASEAEETKPTEETTQKMPTVESDMELQRMRRRTARHVRMAEEAASRVEEAEERIAQLTELLRRKEESMILRHLEEGYTIDYVYHLEGIGCVFTQEELEAIQAEYQGSQERMRIAYDLMRNHVPLALICSATRFTLEELEYIKRRYKSPSPLPPSAE
jgi:hypothetical protein